MSHSPKLPLPEPAAPATLKIKPVASLPMSPVDRFEKNFHAVTTPGHPAALPADRLQKLMSHALGDINAKIAAATPEEKKAFQKFLADQGLYVGDVDGKFGRGTREATEKLRKIVRESQERAGLTGPHPKTGRTQRDGLAGPDTLKAIQAGPPATRTTTDPPPAGVRKAADSPPAADNPFSPGSFAASPELGGRDPERFGTKEIQRQLAENGPPVAYPAGPPAELGPKGEPGKRGKTDLPLPMLPEATPLLPEVQRKPKPPALFKLG